MEKIYKCETSVSCMGQNEGQSEAVGLPTLATFGRASFPPTRKSWRRPIGTLGRSTNRVVTALMRLRERSASARVQPLMSSLVVDSPAPSPEFGGLGRKWRPEHLFVNLWDDLKAPDR